MDSINFGEEVPKSGTANSWNGVVESGEQGENLFSRWGRRGGEWYFYWKWLSLLKINEQRGVARECALSSTCSSQHHLPTWTTYSVLYVFIGWNMFSCVIALGESLSVPYCWDPKKKKEKESKGVRGSLRLEPSNCPVWAFFRTEKLWNKAFRVLTALTSAEVSGDTLIEEMATLSCT